MCLGDCPDRCVSVLNLLILYNHLLMKITLIGENSKEKSCPISRVLPTILSTTEYIYINISANSAPTSAEYSYLQVPCPRGCFV